MKRNPRQTAILLAVLLNRTAQTRSRLSGKTLRLLGKRANLRSAFVVAVADELAEFDWALVELPAGGFGAVRTSALEAPKAATYKRLFTSEERRALRQGTADWGAFEKEASPEAEEVEEEEE